MRQLSFLFLSLLFLIPSAAHAQSQSKQEEGTSRDSAFQVENIALLNSTNEFGQRSPSPKIMGGYIKSIEAAVTPIANKAYADDKTPHNGLVAVAIRPDGTKKFWIDVGDEYQPELTSQLEKAMDGSGIPRVNGGPVAFLLNFQIWGGVEKPKTEKQPSVTPPILPAQWRKAAKGKEELKVPDDLLSLVWPAEESDGVADEETFVPDGFVLQPLAPFGGSILRPKDWHFNQGNSNKSIIWTISKEPLEDGYITGVRIQLIGGIEKSTGSTPEKVVQSFIDSKKKGFKVLSEREETQQGEFTRVGLETEEPQPGKKDGKPFRILYSCFWSNENDMAAIIISGTTTDLWEEHRETFDTMAGLTIVDLKKAKLQIRPAKH